jgi:hypothetical protein
MLGPVPNDGDEILQVEQVEPSHELRCFAYLYYMLRELLLVERDKLNKREEFRDMTLE